jgi:hypothetical protein
MDKPNDDEMLEWLDAMEIGLDLSDYSEQCDYKEEYR